MVIVIIISIVNDKNMICIREIYFSLVRFWVFLFYSRKARKYVLFRFVFKNVFLMIKFSKLTLFCCFGRFYCVVYLYGFGFTGIKEVVFYIWCGIFWWRSLYCGVNSFGKWLCTFLNIEFLKVYFNLKVWLYIIYY